jgi:NADH-quinone oxidoreductase subunit L
MYEALWLVPAFPFAGALVLMTLGARMSRRAVALAGVGSVALSFIVAVLIAATFLTSPPPGNTFSQTLWSWIAVGAFTPRVTLLLDALAVVMMLVVTGVGLLIHIYSVEFMYNDEGYGRFFAYMNLFVAMMLTLVLAQDLLVLYVGWEGVGLASYLLIGFWYEDPANGRAARKAFVVTRVGDAALAIALFVLFTRLGTLDIPLVVQRAAAHWPVGSAVAVLAACLLLVGAMAKSGQVPLQTWLPDAMAGPTPVSALLHAATMVTAGVYLIARLHGLFLLAPPVMSAVAIIGAATLFLAGCAALAQRDIKRILAYSTISQIGYMFLALGVGAWSAAIFHFVTHAFFKALLFLAAGVVIEAQHDEHDILAMGGLRKELPVAFWTFVIAGASLAGVPLVTAGFYSKDWILWEAWSSPLGGSWLWLTGYLGAVITGIYIFRPVFYVFFGKIKKPVEHRPHWVVNGPLIILAILSLIAGFLEIPATLVNVPLFSDFVGRALPNTAGQHGTLAAEATLQILAGVGSLAGVFVAYLLFLRHRALVDRLTARPLGAVTSTLLFEGWGFDALYDALLVQPFCRMAQAGREDWIDLPYRGIARAARGANRLLSVTQSGRVRGYAVGVVVGAVILVGAVLLS